MCVVLFPRERKNNFQRNPVVFIDDNGVLRFRGRLENTDLSEGAKFLIHFPRGEKFADHLIQHIHCKQLHCGV